MNGLLESVLAQTPYIGVVGMLLLSGMGLPLPEDIPLLVGGYLCYKGYLEVWIMIPLALAAVMAGDSLLYALGRRYGHHVPKLPIVSRFLSLKRLHRASNAFHLHGGKMLFAIRFMPGVRAAGFFTAGTFKIPYWKLLVFDGSAALISVPTLVLVAYYFGANIDQVKNWSRDTHLLLFGGLILTVVGIFLFKRWRRGSTLRSTEPRSHGGT